MSGLINVIKNIFSGIFGFIGGLFGGKKAIEGSAPKTKKGNGGYFLEFDDSKSASVTSPASTTSTAAPTAAPEAAPMTVAPAAIAEATNNSDAKPAKTSTRKEKLAALAAGDKPATATAEAAPEAPAAPTPTPAVTKAPVSETAFATKYLVPINNGSRRRPGANMSSYLDMARKMNAAS